MYQGIAFDTHVRIVGMSIRDFTAQLTEIKEALRTRDKLRKDLSKVRHSLAEERFRLKALAETLRKETLDVERLESLSLTALFYEILGSKEEQLNKERQEQLAANLSYVQCSHAVRFLEQDLSHLTQRFEGFKGLDERYESVLRDKERLLLESPGDDARRLVDLAEKIGSLNSNQKELKEAILAGDAVQASLENVIHFLSSAKSWGTWDLLDDTFISTLMKHRRIDDARRHVHEAQVRLKCFERELDDVRLDVSVAIDIGPFATFADYVFDNLITDWIVRSKIVNSRGSASKALENVQDTVSKLQERSEEVARQIKTAVEERRNVVERA